MKLRTKSIFSILGREAVHPFPARMAATIALKALAQSRTPLRVLDPMMGSGTVLAIAKSQGHFTSGVDIDPLAILLGRVWTTPVDKDAVRKAARNALKDAKANFTYTRQKDAYPPRADRETKTFIRYWFDPYTRRQLSALADRISRCRNLTVRDALWCAFSRLIIAKQAGASLALDLSHSRPHKFFETAPKKPFANFLDSVEQVLRSCISINTKKSGPATTIRLGDARLLPTRSNSIDLVLTSPPYLNAIDYLRCSKFSLVWMGLNTAHLRNVRAKSIGTELGQYGLDANRNAEEIIKRLRLNNKLSNRHKALLRRFISDMHGVISETRRVLVPGGRAVFVIGENAIRGTYIRNSKIIITLAGEAGLKLEYQSKRTLPPNRRYLPPPVGKKGAINLRMRQEVVIGFYKPPLT